MCPLGASTETRVRAGEGQGQHDTYSMAPSLWGTDILRSVDLIPHVHRQSSWCRWTHTGRSARRNEEKGK